MSLKKILSDILRYVSALFKSIPADLKKAIHIGVWVTENIKNFVDSPIADIITLIIPGQIDDQIKIWLRSKLPEILVQLKLAENTEDKNSIIRSGIETLNGLDTNTKNAFLHNISILIAQVASNNELSWKDGVLILEWYYQKQYKPEITT